MSYKNTGTHTVIVTGDARLEQILHSNQHKNDQFKISLEDSIGGLGSKPTKSDAYIYDVELSNKDLDSTISAIFDLKKIIADKPLILIGKEEALNQVLNNKKIDNMVSKTINKPISYRQLQLAVDSCLLKPTLEQRHVQQSKKSSPNRIVVLALSLVFILVSAATYIKTKESPTSPNDLALEVTDSNSTISDRSDIALNTQTIERLNQSALIALLESRLNEPTNNNAIYYLNRIKEIDPYNAAANETHNKVLQFLEASYLYHSSNSDYEETRKSLATILEFEPYNQKYAQLFWELEDQLALADQTKPNDNTQNTLRKIEAGPSAGEGPSVEKKSSAEADGLVAPINKKIVAAPQPAIKPESEKISAAESNWATSENRDIDPSPRTPTKPETNKELSSSSDNLVASISKEIEAAPKITIKPAAIIKRVEPYYPKLAADLNYEGWVELEYQVDVDGLAINIEVLNGEKVSTFKNAAIKAIESWEFSPAMEITSNSNTPRLSEPMTTKFNFTLN